MNSPLAYCTPAWKARLAAPPVQAIDLVERPKISPLPPVAMITASPGKARISMLTRSWATQPRHRPVSSSIGPKKSQNSYFVTLPRDFPAADLFVEGVEQLLAGGGAGKGRAAVERAAEAPLVAKALGRAVEGHAQPVHQVDDLRRPVGHFLDRRLVLEEIAAVDGVVKVLPLGVAQLPREVVDAVDAALGADAVRALDGQQAHQADAAFELGQFHGGRQPGQSAADDHYAWFGHF